MLCVLQDAGVRGREREIERGVRDDDLRRGAQAAGGLLVLRGQAGPAGKCGVGNGPEIFQGSGDEGEGRRLTGAAVEQDDVAGGDRPDCRRKMHGERSRAGGVTCARREDRPLAGRHVRRVLRRVPERRGVEDRGRGGRAYQPVGGGVGGRDGPGRRRGISPRRPWCGRRSPPVKGERDLGVDRTGPRVRRGRDDGHGDERPVVILARERALDQNELVSGLHPADPAGEQDGMRPATGIDAEAVVRAERDRHGRRPGEGALRGLGGLARSTSKVCAGTPGDAVLDRLMPTGMTSGSAGWLAVLTTASFPVAAVPGAGW